jgi:hypothetical protein
MQAPAQMPSLLDSDDVSWATWETAPAAAPATTSATAVLSMAATPTVRTSGSLLDSDVGETPAWPAPAPAPVPVPVPAPVPVPVPVPEPVPVPASTTPRRATAATPAPTGAAGASTRIASQGLSTSVVSGGAAAESADRGVLTVTDTADGATYVCPGPFVLWGVCLSMSETVCACAWRLLGQG